MKTRSSRYHFRHAALSLLWALVLTPQYSPKPPTWLTYVDYALVLGFTVAATYHAVKLSTAERKEGLRD